MSEFIDFEQQFTLHDNVPTPIFSRPVPVRSMARIYVQAAAVNSSNAENKTFHRTFVAIRTAVGPPTVGTVTDVHPPLATAGAATWDLTAEVAGNSVAIVLTGQDLATTFWLLKLHVFLLRENT